MDDATVPVLELDFKDSQQLYTPQGANGGVWNGGGWNRQMSGPEIYFSGAEMSSKIPCFAG